MIEMMDLAIRKEEIIKKVAAIRFGKEGYIFINRFNGTALVSNGKVFKGNKKLWEEGIIKAIFRSGETLRLILNYFFVQTSAPYQKLAKLLQERLEEYY